jgi:Ribbon-helix-helix protein, copG family
MIRTKISLDEEEYASLKKAAAAVGISVAERFRRAVRHALPPTGNAPWMRHAGFVATFGRANPLTRSSMARKTEGSDEWRWLRKQPPKDSTYWSTDRHLGLTGAVLVT